MEAEAGEQHMSEAGLGWDGVGWGEAGLPEDSTTLQESGPRVRLKVSCGGAYGFLILVL